MKKRDTGLRRGRCERPNGLLDYAGMAEKIDAQLSSMEHIN